MKKLVMLLNLVLLVYGFAAAQAPVRVSAGGTLSVAARTLALKSSPWFFARTTGTLEYADLVTVLNVSGDWAEIRSVASPALGGWVRSASLSARRITPGDTAGVMEAEAAYRRGGNRNYADVDRIETIYINEAELYWFLEEGRLERGRN